MFTDLYFFATNRSSRQCRRAGPRIPAWAAVLLFALSPYAGADGDTEADSLWSRLAANELKALHASLAENHPGVFDRQNPAVRAWLSEGRAEALRLAEAAKSYHGMYFALRRFVDGFNDAHVTLTPALTANRGSYPGFVAAKRNGRMQVVDSDEADIPVGSGILACDGRSTEKLLAENIAPFYGVDGIAADEIAFAPYLFVDQQNPFIERPARCDFEFDGAVRRVELRWQRTDLRELEHRLGAAAFGAPAPMTLAEWRPGAFWIGLPEFQFANAGARAREQAMLDLIESIKASGQQLRRAKVIVFDVRGNQGGASRWGLLVLEAIWGEGFTDDLHRRQFIGVEWRVSRDNIASMERNRDYFLERYGSGHELTKEFAALVRDMKSAAASGIELMPDYDPRKSLVALPLKTVRPKTILLNNGTCYSACLNFADAVSSIAGSEVWGADTQADTVYMENTSKALPSGLFRISWPMKVYRGRARGNNEAYRASLKPETPFKTTAQAREWVTARMQERGILENP